jgi:hypothetical protein
MIDPQSLTWLAVKDRCEAGLTNCRARIEAHGCDHVETEFMRGRLAAFKEILALAAPPKPLPERMPDKGNVY